MGEKKKLLAAGGKRQRSKKGGAAAVRAGELQRALMGGGDPAGDSQPEPGAARSAFVAAANFIGAEETLEDLRLGFGGDSRPGVGYGDEVAILSARQRQRHRALCGRVFDGVVEEVQHHAAQEV